MSERDSGHFPLMSVVNNLQRILAKREEPTEEDLPRIDSESSEPKEPEHRPGKGILKTAAILSAGALALTGSVELYQKIFSRYDRPDYALKPGVYCYERAADTLVRREIRFNSGGTQLAGYYYPVENAKGLVVCAHGFHAGADDYLPAFEYLTEHQFAVFAFDGKGTYDSAGDSTVGLPEMLVDLDAALNFIGSQAEFRKYPLFLFGHSCGGYAVTAVLNLHKEVRACAAIAPMNCAASMVIEKGELYTGMLPTHLLTELPDAFLKPYQQYLFGNYANLTAVDGINSTDIPVLIAHGNRDMVVDYDQPLSVIGRHREIRRENVYYYVGKGEQAGHDSIWHAADAMRYQKSIDARFKELNEEELTYEEKVRFYAQVDHARYSAVNEELFSQIIRLYEKAL